MPTIRTIAKAGAVLLWAGVLLLSGAVQAGQTVGTVANLSGVLTVRKADGSTRILAQKSTVEVGDILISTGHVYASIRLADDSDLLLRPATRLQITEFAYDEANPEGNHATLTLSEGGIRLTPGLPGLRGDQHVVVRTPGGDIAAGNATFVADYKAPPQKTGAAAHGPTATYARLLQTARPSLLIRVQATAPGLNPGLYVQVLDGVINVSNSGGTQNFSAGQFGFTPSFQQPPVILPANPGIQFTPPPSFSTTTGTAGSTTGSKPGEVDCIVR